MTIAFIGLGNMGGPMARNLAKAGLKVKGFDIAAPAPEGVMAVASVADAVRDAEAVITMLPDGRVLRAIADEAIPAARAGACFVDCSTVDVESARAVAAEAEAAGLLPRSLIHI